MTVEVIDDDVTQLSTIFANIIEAEVDWIQPSLGRVGKLGLFTVVLACRRTTLLGIDQ